MSTLRPSDFNAEWAGKLQAASRPFDGRVALPRWLASSARDQADRVFLMLDATPLHRRDFDAADRLIREAGMAFLTAWAEIMAAFRADREPWAKAAADEAAQAYRDRLDELAPALHAGGVA